MREGMAGKKRERNRKRGTGKEEKGKQKKERKCREADNKKNMDKRKITQNLKRRKMIRWRKW